MHHISIEILYVLFQKQQKHDIKKQKKHLKNKKKHKNMFFKLS